MADNFRAEMRRPLPLALAVIALLGWIVAIWLGVSRASQQEDLMQQVAAADAARSEVAANLAELEGSSGSLTEVKSQIEAETARLAELRSEGETAQRDHESELARLVDEAEQARRNFELEMSRLETAGSAARGRAQSAEGRLRTLMSQVEDRQGDVSELRSQQLANAESLLAQQAELGMTGQRTLAQTQQLADVGGRLDAARQQSAAAQGTVAELAEEAARLSRELAGAETRIQEAQSAEASLQQELTAARGEFSSMETRRDDLERAIAELQARRQDLRADVEAGEEQRSRVQAQVTELTEALSARSDELTQLERRIADMQKQGDRLAAAGTGQPAAPPVATPGLGTLEPGDYTAGPVTATFASDGTFTMTNRRRSETVRGRYAVEDGVLTLSDAEGDVGRVQFPLRCRIEPVATGFRLAEHERTCGGLTGVAFEAR